MAPSVRIGIVDRSVIKSRKVFAKRGLNGRVALRIIAVFLEIEIGGESMSEVEKDRGNEIAERLVDRNGSVCLEVAVNWIAGLEEKVSGLKSALETQVKEAVAIAKQEQSDRIKALEEELAAEKRGHAQAVSDAHMARSQLIESRGRIKELRWAMVAFVTKGEGVDVEDDGGRYG